MHRRMFAIMLLAGLGWMGFGCCANKALNVTVATDEAMRQRPVEVDIVALTGKQQDEWRNYSMTDYWASGKLRGTVPTYKMVFEPGKEGAQTLAATDPIWGQWLAGVSKDEPLQLYVLAHWPGILEDLPGDQDPRRKILPVNSCRWGNGMGGPVNVHVTVTKTGLVVDTAPKAEK